MEILPVLDLLKGIVVRGIAGRRSEYQPLRSILSSSHQPLDVARALQVNFGFHRFYVADLDAIIHGRTNWDVYGKLIENGFQLLVDAGIHNVALANQIRNSGAEPIVGLESCSSPNVLAEIVVSTGGEVTFSLDLIDGRPQFASKSKHWSSDPREIGRQAIQNGVRRIIVLDLADVGTSSGGRTDVLCQSLLGEFPNLQLVCGGGVRGLADLRRYAGLGVSSVLVASALHDGRLTSSQIQCLHEEC